MTDSSAFVRESEADPYLPKAYQEDPWRWTIDGGFFRARTPTRRVDVQASRRAFVGPRSMAVQAAFGLGLTGEVATFEPPRTPPPLVRRALSAASGWSGPLEPIARFGFECRLIDPTFGDDDASGRRLFYHSIFGFLDTSAFGIWRPALDRAYSDQAMNRPGESGDSMLIETMLPQ